MPRVIRPQSPATTRQAALRRIRATLQPSPAGPAGPLGERDRLLSVCEQLSLVAVSVEETTLAWEQRGYWAKADGFRREWSWVEPTRDTLHTAILTEAPGEADPCVAALLVRLIQLGVELHSGTQAAGRKQLGP
jgi:hypothetical protein